MKLPNTRRLATPAITEEGAYCYGLETNKMERKLALGKPGAPGCKSPYMRIFTRVFYSVAREVE